MSFETLGLSTDILRAIKDQGYAVPTPIQLKAIPVVLSGKDVMAGAQTGTGKTAGFTLPLLHRLSTEPAHPFSGNANRRKTKAIRALVITPTRELAAQIQASIETYGRYLPLKSMVVFGGVKINPQIDKLQAGVDILVATPGRLLDHVNQGTLSLSEVGILVLDEADRMLDMGFIHDIRKIMALLPEREKRQNLLFSATFSKEIKQLANRMLNDPQLVEVAPQNATADRIEQSVYSVAKSQKRALLTHLITANNWQQVLVFTRTKHGANRLTQQLDKAGISAAAIHGNKSQSARTKALADFKNNDVRILVATDIAARGLDIDQLPHVVNYELPNVPEDYVHRIGRTARAGNAGEAVSLVDESEQKLLRDIERLLKRELPRSMVEGFVPAIGADTDPDEDRPRRTNNRHRAPEGQRRNRGGSSRQGPAGKKKAHGHANSGAKRRNGGNSGSSRSSGNRAKA